MNSQKNFSKYYDFMCTFCYGHGEHLKNMSHKA
jgi:hypothetical protein